MATALPAATTGPTWRIDLSQPPALVQAGAAIHGLRTRREAYLLPRLWCLHLYRYPGELEFEGHVAAIRSGNVSVIAPGTRIVYHYRGPSQHLYAHFTSPWPIDDRREGTPVVPAMQPMGRRFETLWRQMEELIAWSSTQRRRSEARLWDILWQLVRWPAADDAGASPAPAVHRAYQQAVERIERRLDGRLDLRDLAYEVGVSHNHLIRLFRRHAGMTIAGYIRHRRVQRARHLLTHTTLPAKSIACAVGLPDLQQFNKTLRRELGVGPRALRGG